MYKVLRSCTQFSGFDALLRTKLVMIEISLYDFYGESKSTWFDVNRIPGKFGFELFDIAKVSKNPKNLRTDWAELIFLNNRSSDE